MKHNSITEQTHFLGVLLPEHITNTLQDCRRYMNEAYGCKSGHKTPIHATIIPPFCLPSPYSTKEIVDALQKNFLSKQKAFTAHIDNFSTFQERTLFAKVITTDEWSKLRNSVYSAINQNIPNIIKKDTRPLQIHLTVANRDIPSGVIQNALQVMNELELKEDFPVDNIAVFERTAGVWKTGEILYFSK